MTTTSRKRLVTKVFDNDGGKISICFRSSRSILNKRIDFEVNLNVSNSMLSKLVMLFVSPLYTTY
jgi:hypothetical protein